MSGVEFFSENEGPTSNSTATNSMEQYAPEVKQSKKKTYLMIAIILLSIAASGFVFLKYSVLKKNTNFANQYQHVNQTNFTLPKAH